MNHARKSLLLGALVVSCLGCSTFDLRNRIPWGEGANGQIKRPMKVVAMWTDAVMQQPSASPMRGFGGRVMFYETDNGKPVKVKGSMVVYAFNETYRDPANSVPDRKYVFGDEHFPVHYSKSSLGHSYSFFLPWDEVGGPQQEMSLIVRFTSADGTTIIGEPTRHVLPGVRVEGGMTPNAGESLAQPASGVDQVSHAEPLELTMDEVQPTAAPPMKVTTILMQQSFGQRTPRATVRPLRPATVEGPFPGPSPYPGNGAADGSATGRIPARGTPAGAYPPASAGQPPTGRFGPQRSRALGAPIARLSRDHGPWRPSPAVRPSAQSIPGQAQTGSEPWPGGE